MIDSHNDLDHYFSSKKMKKMFKLHTSAAIEKRGIAKGTKGSRQPSLQEIIKDY